MVCVPTSWTPSAKSRLRLRAFYTGVMPAEQHKALTKKARKTTHIERFHKTLRQRVSRLVREPRSCSETLANHIGALK